MEGDLDEGFATAFVEFVHGDRAGGGDIDGFGFEEGGEFEEVLLAALVSGGIVAAGAFHFDAEEGGANDGAFGGHGDVVAGGGAKSGGAAEAFGALHAEEFGDEEVHGAVVGQGLVKIPAEGTGVVEGGVEDVGVFGEDVLPVAHPAVGPAGIGEEAVDGVGAFVRAGVGLEGFDFGEGGGDADGVEGDAAEEGEVVGEGGDFDAGDVQFGPVSAFADPALEGGDLIGGEGFAFGGHDEVFVGAGDAGEEGAFFGLAGGDGGAIGFAAVEGRGEGVEFEIALGLAALVAGEAVGLEDGEDVLVEVDAVFVGRRDLSGDGGDFGVEEVVDGVGGGELGGGSGDGGIGSAGEPLVGGLAAFGPVGSVGGAGFGAAFGVDGGEPLVVLGVVLGPTGVGVGNDVGTRGEELPGFGALGGDGDDHFTGFGAASGGAGHAADHLLDDEGVLGALGGEFGPDFLGAGRGEAEVGAEVEVAGLFRDATVATGIGFGEAEFEEEFAVDMEVAGVAAAEEEPVFASGEGDFGGGAKEEGVRAIFADTGGDVFLREFGDAEGAFEVGFGGLRGEGGPGVFGGDTVFADLDEDLVGREGFGVDGRRGRAELVAAGEGIVRDEFAVEGEFVEGAVEGIARATAVAGADEDVVGVLDGGSCGFTGHVPGAARGFFTIDPSGDALEFAEGVADGDVVPTGAGGEAFFGDPTVVVLFAIGFAAAE